MIKPCRSVNLGRASARSAPCSVEPVETFSYHTVR